MPALLILFVVNILCALFNVSGKTAGVMNEIAVVVSLVISAILIFLFWLSEKSSELDK